MKQAFIAFFDPSCGFVKNVSCKDREKLFFCNLNIIISAIIYKNFIEIPEALHKT